MTNALWVLACLGTMTAENIYLEVWTTHDTIAGCHVENTMRGFDYSDQQCFCIERKDNV